MYIYVYIGTYGKTATAFLDYGCDFLIVSLFSYSRYSEHAGSFSGGNGKGPKAILFICP